MPSARSTGETHMGFLEQLQALFGGGGGRSGKSGRSGKTIDVRRRFELLREAIAGTMSKFYMARDRQSGEIVGLKLLDKQKTSDFEDRFKGLKKPSEGAIATQLKHKNIVETFEYGQTTTGEIYLIMEFIEGPGLNWVVQEMPDFLNGIRLPLIRQIAEGLNAVHEAGFIHRDICPRNVMVEPNSGVLKLIDFGLAIPNQPEFLQPGNRTGNPNYMAPEIIRRKRTDHRVDVFAFGVTAFEICSLQLPWSRGLTAKAAMDHATQPPSKLTKLRPQVNPDLAAAIASCLEQEVSARCPSMEEFLRRIRHVPHEDVAA